MPFIIQHLIPEKQNLTTVTENDSVQHALSLMTERDFSQLPVVDEDQKCNEPSSNFLLRELLFIHSAKLPNDCTVVLLKNAIATHERN